MSPSAPRETSFGVFLRSLASLLAALGLLLGVPVALVLFVGWPLPTEMPTWASFTESLEQQGVTYGSLVNGLAVIVWLAWMPLAWAILVEAVAAARGRAARRVHAWPGAQLVARKLVASAALLLSSLGGMRAAGAEPLDPLVVMSSDRLSAAEAETPPFGGFPEPDSQARLTEPDGGAGLPGESAGSPELADAPASPTWTGRAPTLPGQTAPAAPEQDAFHVHAVERGDTFWGLAERYLGSGLRWREIRDHNVGRAVGPGRVLAANEDDLQEGWRLEIPGAETAPAPAPAGAAAAEDSAPAATASETSPAAGDTPPASTGAATESPISVQPGDHFWGLAEQQLEQAWGRPVTAEEIAPYWQELVAANLDGLTSGDADLVFPGEQLTVLAPPPVPGEGGDAAVAEPPADTAPQTGSETPSDRPSQDTGPADAPAGDASAAETSTEAPAPSETEPAGGEEEAAPGDVEGEALPEAEGEGEPQGQDEGEVLGSGEGAPAAPERDQSQGSAGAEAESEEPDVGTGVPAVDLADDDLEDSEDDSGFDIDVPVAVPFGASAALAGLLLLALGRRRLSRRRLLRPGVVVEPRPEEDARLERDLALGSRDVLDAVAAASRAYGAALAAQPNLPGVIGLLVTSGLDVVLHLAEPAEPLVPFERGPASDRWNLYLDELDLDPEFGPGPEPSESVLDTPAVLGRTDDGDWLVVDLESLGALEIDGDPDTAADLVRSIVAELALQPQAERMVDITVVGMDGLSPDVLEQGVVAFDTLDEDLVRRVERVAAETDSMQAHRGAAARAQGMPRDGLFVTVVALGGTTPPDPMLLERLATAATPGGRGVAVIAVGAVGSGATRVLVDESGLAHIPHMGLTVEAVRLAPDSLAKIEQLLADEPEMYQPAPEGALPNSWPEWRERWAPDDSSSAEAGTNDDSWMDSWLSSELTNALAGEHENTDDDMGNAGHPGQPVHDHIPYETDGERERAVHEMDTVEVEGLDDMAPAIPNLHAVPAPEFAPDTEPEPLSVRDEPGWPDPSGQAPGAKGAENGIPSYQSLEWEYCVRIFADHVVETPDGRELSFRYGDNPDVPNKNTHRGPELLAYLALSGRAATGEEVKDHMWWDRPVALGTVNKLLYGTRKVLGGAELLSHAQEDPLGRYRLAPTVVTDVQLLSHALEYARTVANRSPDTAVEVLRAHLQAIEAVAFRSGCLGQGLMEWAAAYRVVDAVEQPVVEAALLMSRLSCERGRSGYFDALWAIDQGLRACPYNEALVRMAMEIEALLGNTEAVNHRYLTLATRLARDELEPEPETSELRARLGGTHRLRSAG